MPLAEMWDGDVVIDKRHEIFPRIGVGLATMEGLAPCEGAVIPRRHCRGKGLAVEPECRTSVAQDTGTGPAGRPELAGRPSRTHLPDHEIIRSPG